MFETAEILFLKKVFFDCILFDLIVVFDKNSDDQLDVRKRKQNTDSISVYFEAMGLILMFCASQREYLSPTNPCNVEPDYKQL